MYLAPAPFSAVRLIFGPRAATAFRRVRALDARPVFRVVADDVDRSDGVGATERGLFGGLVDGLGCSRWR